MPRLELDPKQAEMLREILDVVSSDLHDEIDHTDDREYRARLRARKVLVDELRERLR